MKMIQGHKPHWSNTTGLSPHWFSHTRAKAKAILLAKAKAISLAKSWQNGFCTQLPAMSQAKSLLLGVPGKLDNIRNQWSDIAFAFAFRLVWLDHKSDDLC